MKRLKLFSGKTLSDVEDQFNAFAAEKGIDKYDDLKFLNGEYVISVVYTDDPEQKLEHDVLLADIYKSGDISTRLFNVLRALSAKSINDASELTIRQLRKTKDCGSRTINELQELLKSYDIELEF